MDTSRSTKSRPEVSQEPIDQWALQQADALADLAEAAQKGTFLGGTVELGI